MLISNVSQDRPIPYWDEIRNLSIEDKYSLIAKIESSLGDVDMSESTNSIHGIPRELKEDGSSLVRLGFDAVR